MLLECKFEIGVLYIDKIEKSHCQLYWSSIIANYIGKTKRFLNIRIKEHQRSGSAIFGHIENCQNCSDTQKFTENFSVLEKANADFDLKILEALHIVDKRPNLNTQLVNNGSFFVLNVF